MFFNNWLNAIVTDCRSTPPRPRYNCSCSWSAGESQRSSPSSCVRFAGAVLPPRESELPLARASTPACAR